jgi:hypothetical protein
MRGSALPRPNIGVRACAAAGKYGAESYDVDFCGLQSYLGHWNEYLDRGNVHRSAAVSLQELFGATDASSRHSIAIGINVTHAATFRGAAPLRFILDRTRAERAPLLQAQEEAIFRDVEIYSTKNCCRRPCLNLMVGDLSYNAHACLRPKPIEGLVGAPANQLRRPMLDLQTLEHCQTDN